MMIEKIGEPAMYEQLAEECTELAQAALKVARILRDENPTPVTIDDALESVGEEYTDIIQCAIELSINIDEVQLVEKRQRFLERWLNKKETEKKWMS